MHRRIPRALTTSVRRLALALSVGVLAPDAAADELVVVVNKANTQVVDRALVQQLYTGAVRGWPDGRAAYLLDQPEGSDARAAFAATIVGRSPANLRAIWTQLAFTGRGLPPKVATELEIRRLVAANPNAIGYLHASQVDDSVRVVLP